MGVGSIWFFYALLFAMVVWMVLRINRVSTGMAVATFICWPLAIVSLITNWGSRESDIRLPFVVALIATGMIIYSTGQATQDVASMYTPGETEAIRSEDPQFAARIESEQLRDLDVEIEPQASADAATAATPSVSGGEQRPPAAAPASDDVQFAAAPAQIRNTPLRELRFRRGQVRLPQAYARLDVPEHFRFVTAQQLGTLAELRGIEVDSATLGWLVHERVNLSSPDFWFVDVQFHESGHLAAPDAESTPADGDTTLLAWDADRALATWSSRWGADRQGKEMAAAKLMRHGAVVYRLPDLAVDQVELGIRAARLMAARTLPEPGWGYSEFIGAESAQSLMAWIETISAPPAQAAAPAQ